VTKFHIHWEKVREEQTFPALRGETVQGYYIDRILKENLDHLIKSVKNRWDGTFAVTGLEGGGKSTLAQMIANYCDPSFIGEEALRRTIFTSEQFYDILETAKPGQAIVWDEMVLAGDSSDGTTSLQKALKKTFTLIRKKQLYIILVIPSIFMLQTYFALFRTKFLIHVYTPDGLERGFFKFYSYDNKRELYFKGKKNNWNMGVVKPDFVGQFRNYTGYFIDDEKYQAKKDEVTEKLNSDDGQSKESATRRKIRVQRDLLIWGEYQRWASNQPPKEATQSHFVDHLRDRYGEIFVMDTKNIRDIFRVAKGEIESRSGN